MCIRMETACILVSIVMMNHRQCVFASCLYTVGVSRLMDLLSDSREIIRNEVHIHACECVWFWSPILYKTVQCICLHVYLRIGSCLACVYRVMDARGKFGEHERSVRVA